LPSRWARDARARAALRTEAAAAGRVRHANVVAVHDFADPPGGPAYLVMEWVEGGSLADRLRHEGALAPRRATRLAAAVCRALRAVHRAGLLHCDVKPANLLITPGGRVKLGDFGLAAAVDRTGRAEPAAAGTPAYVSPEQGWQRPADRRSDLYSLGAVYYELLTGRPPYRAGTPGDVLRLHRDGLVPDPRAVNPAVPAACAAVVRRALAKDPAQRYRSAGAMLAALENVLAPESHRASSRGLRPGKQGHRSA
jgi:serine/threonine protein kinase